MPATQSPTVHQRRLRVELRRARDEAGKTQDQVAEALEWSLSKVIRIEAGAVNITTIDLKALLEFYEVSQERIQELLTLARASRERAWWSGYRRQLSPQLFDLIGYETAASITRQFEPLVVPGLLQIAEYAHTFISGTIPPERTGDVDTLVEVRMRRQEILDRKPPALHFFILDEAAVRREIGGRQLMHQQLRHLLDMAQHPNVTIEIVPFSAGVHPGLNGAFTILEFPDPEDDDVLHLESPRDIRVTRDMSDAIVSHREDFERLRKASLGPEGSAVLLDQLASSMRG